MKKFLLALAVFASCISTSWSCTDVKITAKDGSVIIARSMEFALDLKSNVVTSPRGREITNTLPNGKQGFSWKAKYAYIFLDGLNTGIAIDGMNDQGLSVEALYLPGETQYQDVPAGSEKNGIAYLHFGDWVLGNFKTIDEVKEALSTVYIYTMQIPQAPNMVFPLHFAIYDNTGKGIIVEFTKGKMQVYDNSLGILTNSPTYDWHMTNIRNFVYLSPVTPKPLIDKGMTFVATGQGAGMHGLPGDVSPPSRFVKMAAMTNTIFPPMNAEEALNMAQHIINNVDIPLGFVREDKNMNATSLELTQWVVFKDLTHKKFYYRTYDDLSIRMIDMNKLNLNENAPQMKMPIAAKQNIIDMTDQLQKA